ncbi:MAG TPA: HAD family phosphatase [Burkholderiaceae bacterium]|nr:HAD family phosphatase [Burkholderiaceae bacterium]
MKLALFDLDHTLLPIDSADTWSHFLVRAAGLDAEEYGARIRHFAATYKNGNFDIEGYLAFQMNLLARFPRPQLESWRDNFVRVHVAPHVRPEAIQLIARHRADGFVLALVTGTHAFVSRAIADLFGIEHLLAVVPEEAQGRFTGRYVGTHTYQEGKVRAVQAFLAARGTTLARCEDSIFYSDSINDLPLLEAVRHPVVTNGDTRLRAIAAQRGWPMLDLFDLHHSDGQAMQEQRVGS